MKLRCCVTCAAVWGLLLVCIGFRTTVAQGNSLLQCPDGWSQNSDQCYRFFNIRRSWKRAAEICRRYGSELSLVENFWQNNYTQNVALNNLKDANLKTYWLGLRTVDDLSTNTLESAGGSFISLYMGFWASDQPRTRDGRCVQASLGSQGQQSWRLTACETLLPFVCQTDACPKGSFFCSNGKCVNSKWKCDGQDDCGDMSDEMDCPNLCKYHFRSSGDSIQSPNYPNKYEPSSDCKWTLEGAVGTGIVLQFSDFETESNFDTVQILSGGRTEETGVNLVTLSGQQQLKTFTTASNIMIVKFRSDVSVEKKGFRASWKTEPIKCGGELLALPNAQLFNSPLYPQSYPGGLECLYIISAPSSKIITLEVLDLELEPEKDFLLIRDGSSPSDPILAQLTGNAASNPQFILSTRNKVYIYLQTSYGDSRKGFSIRFRAGCHVELTSNAGNISSPAFGVVDYPSNQECTYHVKRQDGGGPLSLRFNRFDVADDDFIQVFDGDSASGVRLHPGEGFGGRSRPGITLTASSGSIFVAFLSNPMHTATGWMASFSADCPQLSVGERAIASSRETTFGAKVTYICPVGQEFSSGGDKILAECIQGGNWNVSHVPACQEKYCGPVPQIDNGFAVMASNVTYRGKATYQCYAGFGFPSGRATETIRCQETGRWDKLPTCLASSCPPIQETSHASRTLLNGEGNRYGTVIRFDCEPGYRRTGSPVIVCTTEGQWSHDPPLCERVRCPVLPVIENGFIIDKDKEYFFGDEGRVQCFKGYRLEGSQTIKCDVDQNFTNDTICRDIDECISTSCDAASTKCNNTDGGFYCKCRKGFEPNLECRPVGDLGVANGNVPSNRIKASGTEIGYNKNGVRLDHSIGWCGNIQRPGENWIQFDLRAPVVLRGFRTQIVSRPDGSRATPLSVRLQYSDDLTDLFRTYGDPFGQPIDFRITHNGGSGLSIVSLPMPIEARFVRILIMEYVSAPCLRLELMGCTRQDCHDVNECLDSNGGCDQRCVNSPGSFSCLCNVGYEIFNRNGTAGFAIPDTETGERVGDVYAINKTCVPKQCPEFGSIENGQVLSSRSNFHFGDIVHFQCDFGHVINGPSILLCNSNGEWNGTLPICYPAACSVMESDSKQGLEIDAPNPEAVLYLENVTISCGDIGRPLRMTATAGFRQCVYDPKPGRTDYWLSGETPTCPRLDCGPPPESTGGSYGPYLDTRYQSSFYFGCEETFNVAGRSSRGDNIVRCTEDGTWDFGDLRCEGPVCEDPGRPPDGMQMASSYEHGSEVMFSCERPGYIPYTTDPISCKKNAECKVVRPLGLTSGEIPDSAINSTSQRVNYEATNIRMNSATGWCAKEETFTYVTVDLGKVYRVTGLYVKGVVTNDVSGRPTELRFFYRVGSTENFVVYFPNFNLTAREPGNYGEVTRIDFPTSVRVRQVILAIVSYNKSPCLKFELLGCEDTSEDVLLGYNSGYPICVDQEPPHYVNCPDKPIVVAKSANGLQPVNFTEPTAVDNSGRLARFEVKPAGFKPPAMIFEDMVVQYYAYDFDGNVAVCSINITVPDDTPPALSCPQSYVIELVEKQESYRVNFEEVRRMVNVSDRSDEVNIQIAPQSAFVSLGGYRNVTVLATDRFGNQATCHFQVSVQAAPCVPWSLEAPNNGRVDCVPSDNGGHRCSATCNEGFKFTDGAQFKEYQCSTGQAWLPGSIIPDCVSEHTGEASYDVVAQIEYRAGGAVAESCLDHYVNYVRTFYASLDEILSGRCSAINVQMDISFHNTTIRTIAENTILMAYTLRIKPAVSQTLLYDLCGSTLGLIFDLSVPSTSVVIEPILNITSRNVGGQCPGVLGIRSSVDRGFTCGIGEVLNSDKDSQIPTCLHCPAGTYASMEGGCVFCPRGTFQDMTHQAECKRCPVGTFTSQDGSKSVTDCVSVCGYGTYSPTGLVPCLQCPGNTFTGDPPLDGFKECFKCPANSYTYSPGSKESTDCRAKCPSGMYSETGLEPCAICPVSFYQPLDGQPSCLECSSSHTTTRSGSTSQSDCIPLKCSSQSCQNGGLCLVQRHHISCYCPAGFSGQFCEEDIDECASQPCYNGGICKDKPQGYTCDCPPGYSGLQCQVETSECGNATCPERAMCQNMPGSGNFNCLCRTGYEGAECDMTVDPCAAPDGNPCANDAECRPLQQGRYKCVCPPGWTGPDCEVNIDDCFEEPCLLGANCTDLVNDFKCSCPPGFSGKRCEYKVDLCSTDPCVNGVCVDKLFYHECVCHNGWTGPACDVNVDECFSNPCQNDGQCLDLAGEFKCLCDAGYTGSRCQHEIDSCESDPCQNGATCNDHLDGFSCLCRPGFVGLQCEAPVDECVSSPCDSAGTAECIDQDNQFKCTCNPGYSGELCEVNIDECASDPCFNSGTCTDSINGFVCQCPTGWTGSQCETDSGACAKEPCLNNARCIDLFQDFFCVCPSGTDGKKCQTSPQRCIGEPCMHEGVCHDFGSGLNCTCQDEYAGSGCEYEYDPCADNVCENGATCKRGDGTYICTCSPGFTGRRCEQDIPDCLPGSCPTIATCIDLTNDFYCKCPFNLTGEDCRKTVNIDYDLYVNDESQSSSIALAAPFTLNANSLSVGLWVQYNNPNSKGVFFTLYSVESAHLPLGKRVLLQADETGVLVSLFPNSANDIFLRYLENVPINDGQWHHLVVMWDGTEGSLVLVMDTALAASVENYVFGETLPQYGWVNLGAPLNDENKAVTGAGFHGRLSRVNIWDRTLDVTNELPVQFRDCRNAPVLYYGLLLRWTAYDRVVGNVERESPGTCGERVCPVGYTGDNCHILHQDKSPPQLLHCPADKWVISQKKSTAISWEEPRFTDDLRTITVTETNSLESGQSLSRGAHDLTYVATDEAGNTEKCTFRINIMNEFCTIPMPPVGGQLGCADWGPGGNFKVCTIACDDGLQFSEIIPRFYTCGVEGFWRPTRNPNEPFVFPACSTKKPAKRIFRIAMDFQSTVICSDSGRKILHDRIKDSLRRVNEEWGVCLDDGPDTNCGDLKVNVKCNRQSSTRIGKRQAEPGDTYIVEVQFPAKDDPVINKNSQERATVQDVAENAILQRSAFDVRNILPNVMPDLTSLRMLTDYACPLGEVVIGSNCVECSVGTYYENDTTECRPCPMGFYQNEMGSLACKPCPSIAGRQGTTQSAGSRSVDNCKEYCLAGHYYDEAVGTCQPCGYGFYQPDDGSFQCIPCGAGLTTRRDRAVSRLECREECLSGYELDEKGDCVPCQRGAFRSRGLPACQPCPSGKTTPDVAATSEQECLLDICKPGMYVNSSTQFCIPCPKGSYQDQEDRLLECIKCPQDTTTENSGATSLEECSNPCYVNGKERICKANAACIYREDIDTFSCECLPAYVFNNLTDECFHACENFCENGGTCEVSPVTFRPRCACPANFYGDNCTEKSEFVYVAGGIAGAVLVIILLVLLVWMICVRSNRKRKLQKVIPEPGMDLAGSQANFFYGAPYAESIAPSHHSTYAHYFEDEDEEGWEMPNFYNETYMQDGFHGKTNTLGHSNASIYGAKEELYDRLRRHQYQGKKGDSASESEEQPH